MDEKTKENLEHVGDRFVSGLEGFFSWLSESTKGISLTYRIRCLGKDQNKSFAKIGRRTATLRQRNPMNELFSDDDLKILFSELDGIDEELTKSKQEREERLYPRSRATEQPA